MCQRKHLKWLRRGRFFIGLMIGAALLSPLSAAALTATNIKPTSGSVSGGNTVIIYGSGFTKEEPEKFQDIAAGVEHALLLSESGHVWAVGRNTYGQLGIGDLKNYTIKPYDITDSFDLNASDRIIKVVAGDYYSFAISQQHRIFAWGDNIWGQLGYGNTKTQYLPVEITKNFELDNGDFITDMAAGVQTSYAISSKGKDFFWGDGNDALAGDNDDYEQRAMTLPNDRSNFTATLEAHGLTAGYKTAAMLAESDFVFTWGQNINGELGRTKGKDKNDTNSPRYPYIISCRPKSELPDGVEGDSKDCDNFDLAEGDHIDQIEAGYGVMAARSRLGSVYVWGTNEGGMLGIPEGEDPNPYDKETGGRLSSTPIDLTNFCVGDDRDDCSDLFGEAGLPDGDLISDISVGNSQVLALSQYGRVYSWGDNQFGQLGIGSYELEAGIQDITDQFDLPDGVVIEKVVAAGNSNGSQSSHSYALDSDGSVYSWGGDSTFKPGINMIANVNKPTKISDRLTAKVSNVSTVFFDDEEVFNYEVMSDMMMQTMAPSAEYPGAATISVIDKDGNQVDIDAVYNYTEPESNNPDDPSDDDTTKPDDKGDDNVTGSDDSKDANKDDKESSSDDEDVTKLLSKLGIKDATALQKLLTSGSDAGSSSNIKAPNTGYAMSKK